MTRIGMTTSRNGETTTIYIEGRLDALEVSKLLKECRSADRPLRLGLAGLISVDDVGVRTLRSLQAEGIKLIGASPYVQQILM